MLPKKEVANERNVVISCKNTTHCDSGFSSDFDDRSNILEGKEMSSLFVTIPMIIFCIGAALAMYFDD